MEKPVVGALLIVVGVGVIGWNIVSIVSGAHGLPLGFGAGAASCYIGFCWVRGQSANRAG